MRKGATLATFLPRYVTIAGDGPTLDFAKAHTIFPQAGASSPVGLFTMNSSTAFLNGSDRKRSPSAGLGVVVRSIKSTFGSEPPVARFGRLRR